MLTHALMDSHDGKPNGDIRAFREPRTTGQTARSFTSLNCPIPGQVHRLHSLAFEKSRLNSMTLLADHEGINPRLSLMAVREDNLIPVNRAPAKKVGLQPEIAPTGDRVMCRNTGR